MENPAAWTDVEKTIHQALKAWETSHAAGVAGWSREASIAAALRSEGLLK